MILLNMYFKNNKNKNLQTVSPLEIQNYVIA